ncbi:winged helix-turn-helix transcriptional regulator [Halobellus limi]|jgi:DNA-binding HxlR family transcriptional regulator|uniref:Transcriptional regulator n=1 Tax=Halobellus limi TaxID=699433 RepID=A0A1H5ZUB8_9EURY|nr:helix-turn-helix domain-containing protein [Halobellus limi]QCC47940.1 transcriptional regulator [Halobellus limi]SEG39752.1 transcriptional regulator, HxlR family [Halobellus limi]
MRDSTTRQGPTCDVDGTCYCPLTGVIDTLSKKYAMQLVSIIGAHDSLRFGEIEEHLPGASTSTISTRLDEFEAAGLVSRTQYDEIPPRVEYALTRDGDEVRTRLEPLLEWATDR